MAMGSDFTLNTIVGPGTWVKGDIESAGFTRIDGSVEGDVSARGRVVIGQQARMRGNISGTSITIGGVVHGDIQARERIVILSTGLILGNIVTRRIQADEGCLIHGNVVVCQNDEQWERTLAEQRTHTQRGVRILELVNPSQKYG
ncbi:MAG: polymer-forming cytoskeletal protein [Treponema sp.]|jgi:cytoskeletal protein CcmA (bactofilin family)|nr:polymer-forming cytoskeletal protein [Treponema sp.]